MKHARAFIAERRAAQHCAELLRRGPQPSELLPALTRAGERLARLLAAALAPLTGGEAPEVRAEAATRGTADDLGRLIAPLAASSLLALPAHGTPLLVSLEAGAVLRQVDRAFGGKGEAPEPLPDAFPLSAQLMIGRLEALVAAQLARALGTAEPLAPLRREGSLTELAPFDPAAPLAIQCFEVCEGLRGPWKLVIALPLAALTELFSHGERPAAARSRGPRAADPAAAPFADLPLPLSALLVDMQVPLATISTLAPGVVLPVAVARAVPLRAGDAVLAHGTVGAQDDRVAIKLTRIA